MHTHTRRCGKILVLNILHKMLTCHYSSPTSVFSLTGLKMKKKNTVTILNIAPGARL